jgi:hypothetical protein
MRHAFSMPMNHSRSTVSQPRPLIAGLVLLAAGFVSACTGTATTSASASRTASSMLLPSALWDCGLPAGIPVPESGVLVLEAEVQLDAVYDVGRTPFGRRHAIVTQAGTMKGPKIQAEVLPGGLDYQLLLSNGVVEIEQFLVLRTSDQRYVIMRNTGTGPNAADVRVVYDFEASTTGEFAWLNTGTYVGRRVVDAATRTMRFSVYDVSGVAPAAAARTVRIEKPAGVPAQPWDYRRADPGEQRGEQILVETVTLGRSQAVQAGKRGNRNVIPITGGTLTGLVSGKILFGGADYQHMGGGGPPIDARYLWETPEGDIIIVRNTTNPVVGLVPTFETRVDGKYAWLNSGKYLSSPPGMGAGGLTISMYKSQ